MAGNKIKIFKTDQKVKAVTMLFCGVVMGKDEPSGDGLCLHSAGDKGLGSVGSTALHGWGRIRLVLSFFENEEDLKSQVKKTLPREGTNQ